MDNYVEIMLYLFKSINFFFQIFSFYHNKEWFYNQKHSNAISLIFISIFIHFYFSISIFFLVIRNQKNLFILYLRDFM